jgi:hypothetical protein
MQIYANLFINSIFVRRAVFSDFLSLKLSVPQVFNFVNLHLVTKLCGFTVFIKATFRIQNYISICPRAVWIFTTCVIIIMYYRRTATQLVL